MKKLENLKVLKKPLGWFCILAGAGLCFGVEAFVGTYREIQIGKDNDALTVKMVELAQLHLLVHQLDRGNVETARFMLKDKMVNTACAVNQLLPAADIEHQTFAMDLVYHVALNSKAHPNLEPGAALSLNKAEPLQVSQQ